MEQLSPSRGDVILPNNCLYLFHMDISHALL